MVVRPTAPPGGMPFVETGGVTSPNPLPFPAGSPPVTFWLVLRPEGVGKWIWEDFGGCGGAFWTRPAACAACECAATTGCAGQK